MFYCIWSTVLSSAVLLCSSLLFALLYLVCLLAIDIPEYNLTQPFPPDCRLLFYKMPVWILLLLFAFLLSIIKYNFDRLRQYLLASKLPGPLAVPILGNSYKFLRNPSRACGVMFDYLGQYPTPMRIWLGPHLIIGFVEPKHLEKLFLSTKITYKHQIYDIIKCYLGNGLISNSGPQWKSDRKVIQPLFNLKNFSTSIHLVQKHSSTLIDVLEKRADGPTFDIFAEVHHCSADIISELILGLQPNFQLGQNVEFIDSYEKLYQICYSRMIRPWLYLNVTNRLSKNYKSNKKILVDLKLFMKQGIDESLSRVLSNNERADDDFVPIIELILEAIKHNTASISETDLIDHCLTLFLASEDTISLITSFLCLLFGMYPKYQKLAAEEVDAVFGGSFENAKYEDYQQLKYVDMCIKEVMRLMPVAPIFLRQTSEDFEIDNIVIPKGCAIMMHVMKTHRLSEHWERPNEFYPDHFLPEAVEKRHPYAFAAFSGGPRGCIGKLYAYGTLRLIIANILHHFEIEADGTIDDIKLKADISVRSDSGWPVRLKKRNRIFKRIM